MSDIIKGLGGSLFVRDALRLDYCLQEAVASLVPICEQIVVLDCCSTDGTTEMIERLATKYANVQGIYGAQWDKAENYLRLVLHANTAREKLRTRWHFMLQADEVLHEKSYPAIRQVVERDGWGHDVFRVRRINLYGDCSRQVPPGSRFQPCSTEPARLARQDVPAVGDAESLVEHNGVYRLTERAWIFHYGFVRRLDTMVTKVLEMQSWFHGKHALPDRKVQKMADDGRPFDYREIIPDTGLRPVRMPHPAAARSWVDLHMGGKR